MASTLSRSVNGSIPMSATEAAYFAGFVDGEGTISLAKTKRENSRSGYRFRPYLSAVNTHTGVLQWLQERCGNGRIVCKFTTKRHSPMRRDLYSLSLGSEQMRTVLPQLLPYLVVKKRQAELLLEYLSFSRAGVQLTDAQWLNAERINSELKRLNARGSGRLPSSGVLQIRAGKWKNQWGASGARPSEKQT